MAGLDVELVSPGASSPLLLSGPEFPGEIFHAGLLQVKWMPSGGRVIKPKSITLAFGDS